MQNEFASTAEREASKAQKYPAFAALSLSHVRREVGEALTQFGKFGLLEEYTKHDMSHIDSMLKMYDWIVPEETALGMTAADWLLVTLSTYLHDFGLLITRDEYDQREKVEGFVQFASRVLDNDDPSFMDYRAQLQAMDQSDADKFLYQEFVRAQHASRIRSWLRDAPDPALGFDRRITDELQRIFGGLEETFLDDVGLVCESHHADDLGDLQKYRLDQPYGQDRQEEANVQYAAFLLRTADLLDITRTRTPSLAALIINPRNPKSQLEWAKQAAVKSVRAQRVVVDEDETQPQPDVIEVHAQFKNSEGFFGLTQYLKYASSQLGLTHQWATASAAQTPHKYDFPWRRVDSTHVVAKGFVAEPFKFTIDQGKILDLLTGHTLYNDSGVVVRELFQNALDAVRLQSHVREEVGFEPQVKVEWDSKERTLTVADNGTGMTQSVIESNFLKVGSSRYQDPEFRKSHPDFTSISRFGIGVLTAFMVADDVEVVTVNEHEPEARKLTLRDVHGQYLVRLLSKASPEIPGIARKHGTVVRLKLRSSARLSDVSQVLRHWCVQPGCAVTLSVDGAPAEKIGYESMSSALENALIRAAAVRSADSGLSTPFGDKVEIREHSIGGGTIAFAVVWNQWLQEWQFLRVDPERQNRSSELTLGTAIGGVRVTNEPPGYRSAAGIAAIANVLGSDAPRTNVARSAIERTEEYETYLTRVYGAYIDHIDREMVSLEEDRNYSRTRAAREGAYLIEDIASAGLLESETRFRQSSLKLPFLVVEEKAERERKSLFDLENTTSVWTAEGASIRSFEQALGAIRGTSSVSLTSLTSALGVTESLHLPDGALICGLPSAHAYGGKLFADAWDPVQFETDEESRILRARWTRNSGEPVWNGVTTPVDLPRGLRERIEMNGRRGRERSTEVYVPASDKVSAHGITESVIRCQGRTYIIPGSPLLKIEPATADIPEEHRLWAIAFMVINLLPTSSGSDHGLRVFGRVGHDMQTRGALLGSLGDLGVYEVLDQASTRNSFMTASANMLDVDRWDRRAVGAE